MSLRNGQVLDEYDRPVPGAKIYVYNNTTGFAASLTSDGTTPLAQPIVTDEFGTYSYQVVADYYREDTWYGGKLRYKEVVAIGNPGADLNLRTDLAASGGSALSGFLQSGAGAVARTVQSRLRDTVSVLDFGVANDGSDQTTKIQAALNCGAARVLFPHGSYGWAAVTLPPAVDMVGEGEGTFFVPLDNSSDFITPQGGNRVSGFQLVPATQRTGGTIFKPTGNEVVVDHFKATKCYRLADISGTVGIITFDKMYLVNNNNNNASELFLVNTTGAGLTITNILADNDASTHPLAAIRVRKCGDLTLDNLNLVDSGKALLLDPVTGSEVASIIAGKLYLDTSTSGLVLDTSGGGSIVRCSFQNIEGSSHTSHGVSVIASAGQIKGVTIGYLETHLTGADGLHMTGANVSNFRIGHHTAGGNAAGSALNVAAGCPGPDIMHADYGNVDGTGAVNLVGTTFGAGAGAKILGGTITGNTTNVTGDLTNVTIRNVSGIVTRNAGNGTLASGGTSVVISHGLVATPAASAVKIWSTSPQGSTPIYIDTSTITSTQFTVKCASAAAANLTFGWEASCLGG